MTGPRPTVAVQFAEKRAALIEDVEFLLGKDEPWSIARRVGYSDVDALADRLRRCGRHDLARLMQRVAS